MGIFHWGRNDWTDASIIAESLDQPRAFERLFDRHFDDIHAYLTRRIGGDRADDLAATTFMVAFERRRTFREHLSARPWLYGIATNLMRNEWRAQQRELQTLAELRATVPVGLGEGITARELAELLASLETDQREVLLLYAWEGFSYQEIASVLEVPVGTVRSRMSRARARLRAAHGQASALTAPRTRSEEVTE